MYGLPTREVPPPFGTGSPKATTRGLLDTPYLGSTRLANLPDEAQLARTRHVATAATPRAARKTGSDRRIPIRPNYHSTGRTQIQALGDPTSPMQIISALTYEHTAGGTRRKWGERRRSESMVAASRCGSPG